MAHLLHDGAEVQVTLQGGEDTQEEADAVQVCLDDVPNAGVLDLDGHDAAVLERSLVHLSQRGGGDGLMVKAGEDIAQWAAELTRDLALDYRKRARRHLVLEP